MCSECAECDLSVGLVGLLDSVPGLLRLEGA